MEENDFVERFIFCDKATFHISGKVNVHNVRIWGTEQLHAQIEHQCATPSWKLAPRPRSKHEKRTAGSA